MQKLVISGGEPTLNPDLPRLIAEGRKHCDTVSVNTNGSRTTEELARSLLDAGLSSVMISLYSHEPEVHDGIRRARGLWAKAVRAVEIFARLRDDYPDFLVRTQTVILRENHRTLDEVMRLHHRLGSQKMHISYLEGDFEGRYLLTADEIVAFREETVPRMLSALEEIAVPDPERECRQIRGLYGENAGDPEDLAEGIYWEDRPCRQPRHFTILLAHGEVHPCNIVEYTHEPVMGNLFESKLSRLFRSRRWKRFSKRRFDMCARCPMNLHATLHLR
jgi:MoaA/NifB/PqqE/SkfB family radical SAM enzyme